MINSNPPLSAMRERIDSLDREIQQHEQPDALHDVLSPFAKHGTRLNRIESPAAHTEEWQYPSFIDAFAPGDGDALQAVVHDIGEAGATIRMPGSGLEALL